MATWKVVADKIKLFPHPNSDRLVVGKIGKFQVVCSKDNGYVDGQVVVFAPERSILPEEIRSHYTNTDTGCSYLQGDNHDRVGAVRLRGELSEGATLSLEWVINTLNAHSEFPAIGDPSQIPLNTDLSKQLGISKYIPAIPAELIGKVSHMNDDAFENRFHRHDVEGFRTFCDEFVPGEMVTLTEKVHGSQMNVMKSAEDKFTLTSKYLGQDGFLIDEDKDNKYWQAVYALELDDVLRKNYAGKNVQVCGEMIPCQKKFGYGFTTPTMRIFKLLVEGREIPKSEIFNDSPETEYFRRYWVPFLGTVPFDSAVFPQYANSRERVSGKSLHIAEGIVIEPVVPRLNSEGHSLAVKWLNADYKGGTEDFA